MKQESSLIDQQNAYSLRSYLQWEAHSLGEAREFCQENFPLVHSVEALDRRSRFHLSTASVQLDDVQILHVSSTGHRIKLVDNDRVGLLIPLANRIASANRTHDESVAPGELLIPELGPRTTTVAKDYSGLVVLLPQQYIEQLQAPGEPYRHTSGLDGMSRVDGQCGAGQSLIDYLKYLITELERGGSLVHSVKVQRSACALLKNYLTAMWLEQGVYHEPGKSPSGLESWQVARAEAYIEAHLGEPLTISGIAAQMGISTRTLQAEFRRHRDITPHEFMLQRRLELLQWKLNNAEPPVHVTEIAYECGFTHLGRCAQRYRQRFGETPHETLNRRLCSA